MVLRRAAPHHSVQCVRPDLVAHPSAAPIGLVRPQSGATPPRQPVPFCENGSTPRVLPLLLPARTQQRSEKGAPCPSSDFNRAAADQFAAEQLTAEVRAHRRTTLVALRGELDLATVSNVADVLDGLQPQADGVRHIVLDLRGLTFMDSTGLHELLRQDHYARTNHHNLAVVRGPDAVQRLVQLSGVDECLVLVDAPDDLAPPPSDPHVARDENGPPGSPRPSG
jgi:anti-anti-sigma factor